MKRLLFSLFLAATASAAMAQLINPIILPDGYPGIDINWEATPPEFSIDEKPQLYLEGRDPSSPTSPYIYIYSMIMT